MERESFAILNKVQEDPCVGPAHISLMAAILKVNNEQSKNGFIQITGRELRKISRLSGKALYYRVLKELERFGYINYIPFFEHRRISRIEILS